MEFKREVGDSRSLLRDVTAFANTNGGTVFVGVTDQSEIFGINTSTPQERDKFEQRIHNAVRDSIRPAPRVEIAFEEIEGRVIAKIFVHPGMPLHSLDGRYYVRRGVESVHLVDDEIKQVL